MKHLQFLSYVILCAAEFVVADERGPTKESVQFVHTIQGYHGAASGPGKSPDGKLTLKVEGLVVRLHDAATGKPIGPPLRHRDSPRKGVMVVSHWDFSPDGKLLAVGLGDAQYKGVDDTAGDVYVWEVATGKLVATIRKDIGRVTAIKFTDNKTLRVHSFDVSGK